MMAESGMSPDCIPSESRHWAGNRQQEILSMRAYQLSLYMVYGITTYGISGSLMGIQLA